MDLGSGESLSRDELQSRSLMAIRNSSTRRWCCSFREPAPSCRQAVATTVRASAQPAVPPHACSIDDAPRRIALGSAAGSGRMVRGREAFSVETSSPRSSKKVDERVPHAAGRWPRLKCTCRASTEKRRNSELWCGVSPVDALRIAPPGHFAPATRPTRARLDLPATRPAAGPWRTGSLHRKDASRESSVTGLLSGRSAMTEAGIGDNESGPH